MFSLIQNFTFIFGLPILKQAVHSNQQKGDNHERRRVSGDGR